MSMASMAPVCSNSPRRGRHFGAKLGPEVGDAHGQTRQVGPARMGIFWLNCGPKLSRFGAGQPLPLRVSEGV